MEKENFARRIIVATLIFTLVGVAVMGLFKGHHGTGQTEVSAPRHRAAPNGQPHRLEAVPADPAQSAAQHEATAHTCSGSCAVHGAAKPGAEEGPATALADQLQANRPEVQQLLKQFRTGDKTLDVSIVEKIRTSTLGKPVEFTAGGIQWRGLLDSRIDEPGIFHAGITLDDGLGRFQISQREDRRMRVNVFFRDESVALAGTGVPDEGELAFDITAYELIVCAPKGAVYRSAPAAVQPAAPAQAGPVGALPKLNSNPESTFVLYFDMDGEVVTHPGWNEGLTIDALPHPRYEDEAFVTRVWKRVSEDFAGFDINITTDREVYDAAATSRRVMCVVTPTDTAMPGSGGVAYLDSFGDGTPCWAFNEDEGSLADTISHEVGHTLGLNHDGIAGGEEYYGGHGSGITSWAPIMGAYFGDGTDDESTSWSKGEYANSSNQEDDLVIILSNGFGYKQDDKGDTRETAAFLVTNGGTVDDSGIIGKNTDVDWVAFLTSGGATTIDIKTTNVNSPEHAPRGANLAISAELYDANGVLIQTSNDETKLDARFSLTLEEGLYYIKIDGVGRKTANDGFTNYASMGYYYITGTVPQAGLLTINPPSRTFPFSGGAASFTVETQYDWTWSCDADWVTTLEPVSQQGNQVFNYVAQRNTDMAPRSTEIKISAMGYSVSHTINQDPSNGDDHSNFPDGATPVGQESVTAGNLEEAGDLDVFQIRVTQFGVLTVKSTGSTNTFGEFLSYDGTVLSANDNALLPNFQISREVSPGLYYVRVRHALERGTGTYNLVCSFNSDANLSIAPETRTVASFAADYDFSVICGAGWTWSSDAAWLTSAETNGQYFGQKFTYSVAENAGAGDRVGTFTITSGAHSVTHTVIQLGVAADDHGNTFDAATSIGTDDSVDGVFDYGRDMDVFQVVLPSDGTLQAWSTGTTDTFAYLYDSEGTLLQSNDDSVGINFGLTASLKVGTYYLKLRHFSSNGTGAYVLHTAFSAPTHVTASYATEPGGILQGVVSQVVPLGGNPSVVTAVPKAGYAFIGWSDGHLLAARDDQNLVTNLSVTARFQAILSVSHAGGDPIRNNQFPAVDYGIRWINELAPMTFEIWNNGTTPLTGLNVAKSGIHASEWTITPPAVTTLQPGTFTTFTATLQAVTSGAKTATFTITVNEATAATFRLPVTASILDNVVVVNPDATGVTGSGAGSATTTDATVPVVVLISADGCFHHFFSQPKEQEILPDFYISTDGVDWRLAEVVAFRQIGQTDLQDEFEVALSPAGLNVLSILVTTEPNAQNQP